MSAIFFIGIGIAFFLGALVFVKKNKAPFDFILLSWLVINAFHLIYFYTNIVSGIAGISILSLIPGALLAYLSAPMLFLYVQSLIHPERKGFLVYFVHAIPYLVMLFGILYYALWDENVRVYISDSVIMFDGRLPAFFRYYSLIMALSNFLYPLACLYLLYKHQYRIKEEFSFSEKITLNWLKHWLTVEFVGFLISFTIIWVANFQYMELIDSFKVISIIIVTNVFIIGFYGIRQEGIFIKHMSLPEGNEKVKQVNNAIPSNQLAAYKKQLNRFMEEEKLYLEPKLSVNDLSNKMEISRHSLSQLLNDHLEISFYDYINRHRIADFKQRVNDPKYRHLSILGIALECGFNSKSAFNMIFKKNEGMTPSAYKKQLKIEEQ